MAQILGQPAAGSMPPPQRQPMQRTMPMGFNPGLPGGGSTPTSFGGPIGNPGYSPMGGAGLPGSPAALRPMGSMNMQPMSSGMSSGGGTPSWLAPLLQPTGGAPQQQAAPMPQGALTQQQQMAQNTARGNTLRQTTQTSSPYGVGGIQTNGLGQVQMNGNNHSLAEGVPLAGHIGTANGPLTAGSGGGGGGFGFGGGAGGQGGQGGLAQTVQQQMDKANAANEQRYQQLLGLSGQLSDADYQRAAQQGQMQLGRVDQSLVGAGLGNSTIKSTMEQGVNNNTLINENLAGDQGIRAAMGIVQGRTDQQPNYALLAQLASQAGAYGGGPMPAYGSGGAGGGGGGAYGSGGQSAFYQSLANANAANNQAYSAGSGVNNTASSNNNAWGQQVPDGYMHQQPNGQWGVVPFGAQTDPTNGWRLS